MSSHFRGPPPGDEPDREWRMHQIRAFWEQLYVGEDPGETTWEELDALLDQVTMALACDPPDVSRCETLTAYAAMQVAGLQSF